MKTRSKMILGLASLLGVTAGATAVSGFAWFVTTKTADVEVTKIGVYSKNPTLSVSVKNLQGLQRTNDVANDFDLETTATAGLTDISSNDGIHFYDPTWQAAGEGKKATKFEVANEGEQYLSFDMEFVKPSEGSLFIFLDQPSIKAATAEDEEDEEAADVARVAFSQKATPSATELTNVLTLGRETGTGYDKGLTTAVESLAANGDYTVANYLDDCENLYEPADIDYSVRSTGVKRAQDMFITEVTSDANVTVHVTIWLEGSSHVSDETGDNSKPIGGEIEVKLPIVAFTTATNA